MSSISFVRSAFDWSVGKRRWLGKRCRDWRAIDIQVSRKKPWQGADLTQVWGHILLICSLHNHILKLFTVKHKTGRAWTTFKLLYSTTCHVIGCAS